MSITDRVERIRLNYVNSKPAISYERARIWTESHKRTEGQPVAIRVPRHFMTPVMSCVSIFSLMNSSLAVPVNFANAAS